MGVFTLFCFLAKFVRSLAKACWVYKGKDDEEVVRSKMVIVEMCFWNSFYLQHGILGLLLVLQDS